MKSVLFKIQCLALASFCLPLTVCAEWASYEVPNGPRRIVGVALDSHQPNVWAAFSDSQVFVSKDQGHVWEVVYSEKSYSQNIRDIVFSRLSPGVVVMVLSNSIRISHDAAKTWKRLKLGRMSTGEEIHCVAFSYEDPDVLWVGSEGGLNVMNIRSLTHARVNVIGTKPIYKIVAMPHFICAVSSDGVYQSVDNGQNWTKIIEKPGVTTHETPEDRLNQFGIEEVFTRPVTPTAFFVEAAGSGVRGAVTYNNRPVLYGDDRATEPHDSSRLPFLGQNFIVYDCVVRRSLLVLATNHGLVFYDLAKADEKAWSTPSDYSQSVYDIAIAQDNSYLVCATEDGLKKYTFTETKMNVMPSETRLIDSNSKPIVEGSMDLLPKMTESVEFGSSRVTQRYEQLLRGEPTIGTLHRAAIEYANVNPEIIRNWQSKASRKAWLPKVSLTASRDVDENVDLDRGGTGDPDTFIQGPDEGSRDLSVSVSWDLSELVWNSDKTSIDSRSRLMTELRQDILSDINHLYYERRRLLWQLCQQDTSSHLVSTPIKIRLEELAAELDALTGGFMTRYLTATQVQIGHDLASQSR